ncbi:electron transport complex subunit RsxE [Microaceticoccus formicicus]|uniref:electron transport complex subunit RsxE n=1 Tax=Microaceticoccus formicicus TaxID=3118105 RepID=UPI003CD00DD8|nr:electron transport complex subunit E [Peptoniphilaceae bacterium AMB_02]
MKNVFFDGIFKNNPVIVQLVGLCSVLAITTTVVNAIGMGAAVTFVLLGSNIVVSLLRNFIPDKVRIPSYIVIIATFVTIVKMMMEAYMQPLYQSLGIFIPLIVVNCIILARAESFASKRTIIESIVDALGQSAGYTVSVVVLAAIRELFGSGTLMGARIIPEEYVIGVFTQAPGAYIILGVMIGVFNILLTRSKNKELTGGHN